MRHQGRGYGFRGWVWIGLSLVLVAAMVSLWVVWPPRCSGSVLCIGGPPEPIGKGTSASQRVPSERRVPSRPKQPPEPHQEPTIQPQVVPVATSAPEPVRDPPRAERPDRPDRPEPHKDHDEGHDKVYGWEKHGKPPPPGHGGEPPGRT